MTSLKKISDRIVSVKSTRQITSSMKVVAVSRLKKKHAELLRVVPYEIEMKRIVRRLVRSVLERQEQMPDMRLPALLVGNHANDKRYMIIVVTSDDGLSGASHLQVVHQAQKVIEHLQQKNKEIHLVALGQRGAELLKRLYPNIRMTIVKRKILKRGTLFSDAERVTADIIEAFSRDKFDVCLMVYNRFKSVVSQWTMVEQVMPAKLFMTENPWHFLMSDSGPGYVQPDQTGQRRVKLRQTSFLKALGGADMLYSPFMTLSADDIPQGKRPADAYDYDPSDMGILEVILPQYLSAYVYRMLLDSDVSDNAARLMAMDNATRNAGDMLAELNQQYRRSRQAKITTDIAENSRPVGG